MYRPPLGSRMRLLRAGVLSAAVLALVLLAGCGSDLDAPELNPPASTGSKPEASEGKAAPELNLPASTGSKPEASEGKAAPDFSLPASTGTFVSLSQLLSGRDAAVLVFYRGFF